MRKVHKICLLLFSFFLVLPGCFPIQYTINPGASGKVVDSNNHEPIFGASVVLKTSSFKDPKRFIQTSTDQHGEFLVEPEQEWGIYIVPMDPFPLTGSVTVEASGYKPSTKEFRTSTIGPANSKLGVIPLEPE